MPKNILPPGEGRTLWISAELKALVTAIAEAEDRPMQTILARAVRAYAAASHEYQETLAHGQKTPAPAQQRRVRRDARSSA